MYNMINNDSCVSINDLEMHYSLPCELLKLCCVVVINYLARIKNNYRDEWSELLLTQEFVNTKVRAFSPNA